MENQKIAVAMVKVQAGIKAAAKSKLNPFFKNKYADLGSVWEACHEALTANGIAVIQSPEFRDGVMLLKTTLLHESGESISGEYLIRPVKDDPQGYGSAVTYARRYSLASMIGIIQDDDDGQRGSTRGKSESRGKVAEKLLEGPISEVQAKALFKAWKQAGKSNEEVAKYLNENFEINTTSEIKKSDYSTIYAWVSSSAVKS